MVDRNPGIRQLREIAIDIAEADVPAGNSGELFVTSNAISQKPDTKLSRSFAVRGKDGRFTKRPSNHTDRAYELGLEARMHQSRLELPAETEIHVANSVSGQVFPHETQPEFARTRIHPFVVSDSAPAPIVAFQAKSRE